MRTTKEVNRKYHKTNNGITLIALVITIIVMLILVAVTITMAVNGGLFNYAGKAATQTNDAIKKEQELANLEANMKVDELINKYTGGTKVEEIVPNPNEKFSSIYQENETITQGSYTAVIPKGFAVAVDEEGEVKSIADGLVITDKVNSNGNSTGNEFVWIPVTFTASGTLDSNGLDSGFLATFKRSTTDEGYSEPYASGYSDGRGTEEAEDYYDMMLSVQKNKGFYIGRYEAGIEQTGTPRTLYTDSNSTIDKANGESKMVVKRDCYPYNCVGWGSSMSENENTITYKSKDQGHGAVYLSKHLLDGQTTGATSTLCYGVQWDAMVKFLGKDSETDSTQWGNYDKNEVTIDRPTARWTSYPNFDTTWTLIGQTAKENSYYDNFLLTTGASDEFMMKNIYDVAGNCFEWTNEASSATERVVRGGSYYENFVTCSVSMRDGFHLYGHYSACSFRPVLYITNNV